MNLLVMEEVFNMTFGKRQLVIASLVVALGAAVYLNWQFSDTSGIEVSESEASSVKQLGQTTYVNTEISTSEISNNSASDSKKEKAEKQKNKTNQTKTKAVNAEAKKEHFSAEKEKRNQSNEKAIESLTDIIESASSDESAKKSAVESAKELAENIKLQTDIENEIITRGFDDAYVIINNNSCCVSVFGGKLDDSSALAIKEIVNRQSDIEFTKITVSSSGK